MPRGGYRPGAGRKPGSKGKRTEVLAHLVHVMRDETRSGGERLTAAVAAVDLLTSAGANNQRQSNTAGERGEHSPIIA